MTEKMWVIDDSNPDKVAMVQKSINFVPGLYKIFDEILVNAADNIQRDKRGTTQIKVSIDQAKGQITVYNNGKGIPVVMHKEHKMYVPELVFGHLLTSSNYDDSMKKVTGGRNGFGAKLTNIFSKKFQIECADSSTRKLFKQTFKANMSNRGDPVISEFSSDAFDYTKVIFEPDMKKFKVQ